MAAVASLHGCYFSYLHTEEGLKSLNEFLSGKTYIYGDQLTKDDIKVYGAVTEKPSGSFPNDATWYDVVSLKLAASFPGTAQGVKFTGSAASATAAPAQAAAPASEEEDDDLDLFGDETEEERRQQRKGKLLRSLPRRKKVENLLFCLMLSLGMTRLT